ncbi:MAG: hypothetical protein ACHQ1D_02450 [Nitrososphaerales archaeon]
MARKYDVIPPNQVYQGKTYSDLVSDWFNWFLTTDPDKHTLGPVVFLRSVKFPATNSKPNGAGITSDPTVSNDFPMDPSLYRSYVNEPNVRVGKDRLQIYLDQALLAPVITAYSEASRPYVDWGLMQDFTGLTIDRGDDPPDVTALTINGENVIPSGEMYKYRVVTPVFTAIVPEAEFGRSLKDYLETSIAPGHYPVIVEGYFVLIRFNAPEMYWIHSQASAGREMSGPYFSESLYQVEVSLRPDPCGQDPNGNSKPKLRSPSNGRPPNKGALGFRPAQNEGTIIRTLSEKVKAGELSMTDVRKMGSFFKLNVGNIGDDRNTKD